MLYEVITAIPGFNESRKSSIASRVARDLKTFTDAFEMYATEHGGFPADKGPADLPDEMKGYISEAQFESKTP